MSLKHFIQDALSSWMKQKGPESDIVLQQPHTFSKEL